MKVFLKQFAIFVVLAVTFSALTGCTASSDREKVMDNAVNIAVESAKNSGDAPPKSSDYPPLASAVAQADLQNFDGTTFKVADKKGKVLLLNMWATWCGPCRAEMPALVRMQDAHRDAGFEVIGLNTDDEPVDAINAFAEQMKLNYTLVWADTGTQAALLKISRFNGIPQSFIVDREGNLRGVFRGANPADIKTMEELVAKVVAGHSSTAPHPGLNEVNYPGGNAAVPMSANANTSADKADSNKQ